MYTSTFLTLALSATTLAVPVYNELPASKGVRVLLSNQATELGTNTILFPGADKADSKRPVGSDGPFKTVTIAVGEEFANKDIRCQLIDPAGQPIQARRGKNLDTTFSDGKAGEWTFVKESKVEKITCDPKFKKATAPPPPMEGNGNNTMSAAADTIRVLLANPSTGIAFKLHNPTKRVEHVVKSPTVFKEVTLTAPKSAPALRCQIQDMHNKPITILRGENVDVTFSDAGKGKWTFKMPEQSSVGKIVCDPAFKKASD